MLATGGIFEEVDLSVSWLLDSGISAPNGGWYAWYDVHSGTYPFLYSEISGYALTTMSYVLRYRPQLYDGAYLIERIERTANWLISEAWNERTGGVKSRIFSNGTSGKAVFGFDNGMVLTGLLHAASVSSRPERYLAYANRIGNLLIDTFYAKAGVLHTRIGAQNGSVLPQGAKWSEQSGPHQAKTAIPLLFLGKVTGDERLVQVAVEICDRTLQMQCQDGRFITDFANNTTFLHPHCYALEGLYVAGTYLNNQSYLESARRGLEWALGGVQECVPRFWHPSSGFLHQESADITAQLLRMSCLLAATYPDLQVPTGFLAERLLSHQGLIGDRSTRGGFVYGYGQEGVWKDHYNAWATFFALQALDFHQAEGLPAEWDPFLLV